MGRHKTHNDPANQAIGFQRLLIWTGIALFILKLIAYLITDSVSVLSDALESVVNIVAAILGLFSLRYSIQPKDKNHPYGHGKIEFLTSGIEGILILGAGGLIMYEAVKHLFVPEPLLHLDIGMILIGISGLFNYLMGVLSVRNGKQMNSPVLISGGKHLKTDALTTIGVMTGMLLVYLTNLLYIDSLVAILFAVIIIRSGYGIIKSSVSAILDEADEPLLKQLIAVMEKNRKEDWIDLHNLRIIRYAHSFHVDAHVTLPWYYQLDKAHECMDDIEQLIRESFDEQVELFLHIDPCIPASCKLCGMKDCKVRQYPREQVLKWTYERVITNQKHLVDS